MNTTNLESLGWNPALAESFARRWPSGLTPARISSVHGSAYDVLSPSGRLLAELAGKLRPSDGAERPATGDWVALAERAEDRRATIHGILPRRTKLSRKVAGATTQEQVVAANVDLLFMVMALDDDFSPRRAERYLSIAWEAGIQPVILLNKSDGCDDFAERLLEIEAVAPGVPVLALSARTGSGIEQLATYLTPGRTVALLGSSGVGKSTLVNRLSGSELLETRPVRECDGKGRHTTTHRELVPLPQGAILIDNPGLRELQLWEAPAGVAATFHEIGELASGCQFRDCTHRHEPGCAVKGAVETGELSAERFRSWQKLDREQAYLSRRVDQRARLEEKRRWRTISKAIRRMQS